MILTIPAEFLLVTMRVSVIAFFTQNWYLSTQAIDGFQRPNLIQPKRRPNE